MTSLITDRVANEFLNRFQEQGRNTGIFPLRFASVEMTCPLCSTMEVEGLDVAQWVRLCGVGEAPAVGKVAEAEAGGVEICLANVNGTLSALDNVCPHRQGPLGQGWLEGEAVVCPWHSWTFSLKTGLSEYPVHERVDVFAVRVEGEDVMVNLEPEPREEVEAKAESSSH